MVAGVEAQRAHPSALPITSALPEGRRPALTGLRAVAVILVVGFHLAGDSVFAGGFLGVDVFFVLSGYLITGLLLADARRHGRARLGTFWLRRIRRLVPPLLFVGVVATLAVRRAGAPEGWLEQRLDLLWTLAYAANWHLLQVRAWSGGTPFLPPLAHAWSLAVEEQFYLVWPLVVVAGLRVGGRRRKLALLLPAGVAVAGGLLSVWWLATRYRPPNPVEAQFATWGRMGELLAGALLALGWATISARLREPAARHVGLAGWALLLLAFATLRFSEPAYYRGGAVIVCVAVVAVIVGLDAGGASATRRLLGATPFVLVGEISYGLYLFHHVVFLGLPVAGLGGWRLAVVQACRLSISLGLAVVCYLAVERPLQRCTVPWVRRSPGRLLIAVGTATAGTVALSTLLLQGS